MGDQRPLVAALIDAARPVEIDGGWPPSPSAGGGAALSPPAAEDDDGFDGAGGGEPPDGIDWDLVRACAEEAQNDIGNSRRLRLRAGGDLIHVHAIGWFVWDGRRWAEDLDDRFSRPLAHATAEAIHFEAHVIEPTERERAAIETGQAAKVRADEIPHDINALDDVPELTKEERKRRLKLLAAEAKALETPIARGALAARAVEKRKSDRRRFANASGNAGKLDGMLGEARSYLSRTLADLDTDPLALNVENGTLRFVAEIDPECPDPGIERMVWRARLDPHRREDLFSKIAPVTWREDAGAPLFHAFIERVLPDLSVRRFVQRYLGYALTGLDREQVFAFFHGEGANGKSTLVDLVCRILGDYTTTLPIATLVGGDQQRRGAEATPDLAKVPGARFVRTAEPKEGLSLDESLIKQMTSGEPIPIRRLNKEFIDVYPRFKLVISANRKPVIKGDDDGMWRRVYLVPFGVQIPKGERDKGLSEKLWAEREGVLAWLVEGALDYLNRGGLDAPSIVLAATDEYRAESDMIGAFVRGALDVTRDPLHQETPGRLYSAFVIWCKRNAQTPFQPSTFNRRMPKAAERAGFVHGKASNSIYTGVRILPDFDPSRTHGDP